MPSCLECGAPMSHEDIERGMCPKCKTLTPEREAELAALDEKNCKQREELSQRAVRELKESAQRSREERLQRLREIPDEVWQAAVEADKKRKPNPPQAKPKATKDRQHPLRPEEVEMTCPLCGHDKVMRYPQRMYDQVRWHYVCQGCKCAFDPGSHGL